MNGHGGSVSVITDDEYDELKSQWRSSRLASFLVRHALCVTERDQRDPVVTASPEAGCLRCRCRCHDEALDVPDGELPVKTDTFWLALCAGVATEHRWVFVEDQSGELLALYVNRLSRILSRAAMLGNDAGGAVH